MSSIREIIRKIAKIFLKTACAIIPLQKIILFESLPNFADSTICVYNKLKSLGYDKKYKFIWIVHKDNYSDFKKFPHVTIENKFIYFILIQISKYMILNNYLVSPQRENQKVIFISHGEPTKITKNYYYFKKDITGYVHLSAKYDAIYAQQFRTSAKIVHGLGLPRNDILLSPKLDLKQMLKFNGKIVFYYPTVKIWKSGNKHGSGNFSDLLLSDSDYEKMNKILIKNNCMLLVKMHWGSGNKEILLKKYSNILTINDGYFANNDVTSYQCLASSDALLTDYSSVFYDYLIVNKPIGLVWTDYKQYSKSPGLAKNFITDSCCAKKIYNLKDFEQFLNEIKLNKDPYLSVRRKIFKKVYTLPEISSTNRVTDYIINEFNL